jgi:HAD superfamily hydrolase (TIGR01662 family)
MATKWIFFDMGSTLVDETEAYDHRVHDMITGTNISFKEFDDVRIALARQGLDGNSAAIKHFGLTKTPWHSEDEVPYPDTLDTLRQLFQKGYRLGIIANQVAGASNRLSNWGLREYFDVVVTSAEAGIAKPEKAIFELAFTLAGCKPEESMMVGDRLDNDIHPAQAMGMKTVWIRHGLAQHQNPSLGHELADYQIEQLRELIEIL